MFRSVALWVVLMVAFLASFARFSGGGDRLEWWVRDALVVVPFLLVAAFMWFTLRRARQGQREAMQGVALLQQGRFLSALERFDAAGKRLPKANAIPFNRGLALVSLWRLEEAEQAFADCARRRWYGNADLSGLLYPMWALSSAVLGRTEAARERLALAEKAGAGDTGQVTLARLTLAVRAGDWAAARDLARRFELTQLGGWTRGLTDALTAWAAEQVDGATPTVNPVPLLGETGLPEVRAAWPELAELLARASAPPGRSGL